jgi:hypothetical protein
MVKYTPDMAERYAQEGKGRFEGFWRFLAIGLTIGAVIALINDEIFASS